MTRDGRTGAADTDPGPEPEPEQRGECTPEAERAAIQEEAASLSPEDAERRAALDEARRKMTVALDYHLRERDRLYKLYSEHDEAAERLHEHAGALLDGKTLGAIERLGDKTLADLPTLDQTLASMPGPGERLETGIRPLDECSRGGFARGRVYTFLGPPGKGKTALLTQLCRTFAARYKALVIGLFCDEGSWQAAVMMAEGLGFDRDRLEDAYGEIRPAVAEKTATLDIRLPHPDDPDTVLDSIDRWLEGVDPKRLIVFATDSVQTVRLCKGAQPESRKERVAANMSKLKAISRRHNAVVLDAAKANRASWKNKKPSDNTDPLAGGLDDSSIEYDSDALFFLSGDPAEKVFLTVCKNRPGDGTRPTIALGFNRDRATFAAIDATAAEAEAEETAREQEAARWSADEARVIGVMKEYPARSQNFLREQVHLRDSRLVAILEELHRKGRATCTTSGRSKRWSYSSREKGREAS